MLCLDVGVERAHPILWYRLLYDCVRVSRVCTLLQYGGRYEQNPIVRFHFHFSVFTPHDLTAFICLVNSEESSHLS